MEQKTNIPSIRIISPWSGCRQPAGGRFESFPCFHGMAAKPWDKLKALAKLDFQQGKLCA